MSNPLIYVITFLVYSSLAIYFWRAQSAGNVETLNRGMIGHALLVPLSLHAYLLGGNLFGGGSLNLGLVNALSLILWLTMAVYWVARFFYSIASLQTLVLPLAAVAALLPALFPTGHPATNNLPLLLGAYFCSDACIQPVHHRSPTCQLDVFSGKGFTPSCSATSS